MSMAIKYGLQKKAKMAKGGCVEDPCPGCESCDKADEPAAVAGGYAEGGEVSEEDLVSRIMKKRKSKGAGDTADEKPADFDRLDQMEIPDDANYTGANSGDELGNEEMDENDRDLIARIMRSRAKKDRMPRPA